MSTPNATLLTPQQLKELIAGPVPVRLLDVRWRLDLPDGREEYARAHLPGAVYVDLSHELAAHDLPASEGRHPLPSIETLERAARSWGLNPGDVVVAYDDYNSLSAARAWWVLSHAGIDIFVLDGGVQAWLEAGFETEAGEVEAGEAQAAEGTVELDYGDRKVIALTHVLDFAHRGILVDSRAPERFRGEVEPYDPKAGHIPGASNIPAAEYQEQGRMLSPERLREVFAGHGIVPGVSVGVYCGSGVTAAHTALALSQIGIDAAIFPGSWSQWSQHPELPVATGQ